MEKHKLFNDLFETRGGLIDLVRISTVLGESEGEYFRVLIQNVNAWISSLKPKYPNLPDIYANGIMNYSFNASVCSKNGLYFLGFNFGLYPIIFDLFSKMLATKGVLSKIGNDKDESSDKKELSVYRGENGVITYIDRDVIANTLIPKDPMRLSYVHHLTQLALKFLIHHECGHILRGHVDYYATISDGKGIDAYNYTSDSNKLSHEVSQVFEMDADSFATNHAFIYANYMISNNFKLNEFEKIAYQNWETFIEDWVIALYSIFKLTGFKFNGIEDSKSRSHPATIVRLGMITNNVITLFHSTFKDTAPQNVPDLVVKATIQAEVAFTKFTHLENEIELFSSVFLDETIGNYTKSIPKNWNAVRPLIEKFAFGELPPYV